MGIVLSGCEKTIGISSRGNSKLHSADAPCNWIWKSHWFIADSILFYCMYLCRVVCVCAHTIIITQSNVMTARCFVVLPVRKSVICIWRVPKLWGIVYVNVLYIILLLLCAVIHHLLLEENLQIQNQILFLWIFSRYCNSHQVYFVSKYLYIFLIIIFIFPVFFFAEIIPSILLYSHFVDGSILSIEIKFYLI